MSQQSTPTSPSRSERDPDQDRSWLDAEVDGRSVRSWVVIGVVIAVVTIGVGAWWTYGLDQGGPMAGGMQGQQADDTPMGDMAMSPDAPRVPPVFGYHDGEPIAFIHTEVSDPQIGGVLEEMMGSPVPVVASLAAVPEQARSTVYVFTNGVVPEDTPAGPVGFQPDVFATAPGDDGYTPLVEIVEATWAEQAQTDLLTTTEQIQAAEADGSLTLEPTGVVINAPLLTWPGGQR